VKNRQIEYDLRWLLAVLIWATISRDDRQRALLDRNPFTGLKPPKEQSPTRRRFTPQQYKALRRVAARMDPLFELAVIVTHETGHRIGSVRHLRWSDLELKRKWVRWVSAHDKMKTEHEGPLSGAAVRALQRARRRSPTIGDAWVFPSPGDPSRPCSATWCGTGWSRRSGRWASGAAASGGTVSGASSRPT
jgi:integrase